MTYESSMYLPSQDCSSSALLQSGIPSHRRVPAMQVFSTEHKNIPSGQSPTQEQEEAKEEKYNMTFLIQNRQRPQSQVVKPTFK